MLRVLGGIVVWIVILFGANTLAFSIAGLVARFRAGHDGGVMYMDLRTPTYLGAVITVAVSCLIVAAGIGEGLCLVSAMHITAAIWVNDEESGLKQDLVEWLDRLAPSGDYRHHQTGEDNADAHLKRTIMGHQVMLPITNGALDLGPWEQVFYAEFDGQRRKRVVVKAFGI